MDGPLETGYMNPENPVLLAETLRISREWMLRRRAMEA